MSFLDYVTTAIFAFLKNNLLTYVYTYLYPTPPPSNLRLAPNFSSYPLKPQSLLKLTHLTVPISHTIRTDIYPLFPVSWRNGLRLHVTVAFFLRSFFAKLVYRT
jgi:hypothetical protein